jgi:hypothetical protein
MYENQVARLQLFGGSRDKNSVELVFGENDRLALGKFFENI